MTQDVLTFSEAARRAGVSRQRLNRAIHLGQLPAQRGGGPGKPTRIRLEDLQAWCSSEGLAVPIAPAERSAHAPALIGQPDMTALMARLEQMVEQAIARAIDQVVERLAERLTAHLMERLERAEHLERPRRSERMEHPERSERALPTKAEAKAAVLARIRQLKAQGLTLQAIAERFTAEGVPTLSGKGSWSKGTIANLLKGL
jgi:excisionase family DNA binding protein